jgi:hypothetical protein
MPVEGAADGTFQNIQSRNACGLRHAFGEQRIVGARCVRAKGG